MPQPDQPTDGGNAVRVRRVHHGDPSLRELHKRLFPADPQPRYELGSWWLLDVGERAVAFCGIQPSQRWGDTGYLVRAAVHPKFRGRGIQKQMIRLRENHARRQGWRWAITCTFNNPASANNLIACGYRLYEPADPYGAPGTLYWRRKLVADAEAN
jgi:ribosomal protein S18 acetylase RimI-like enzyme